jgi:type VI secretion system secreted protein VgrG
MSLYSYAYSHPVNLVDPNGERPLTPGEIALARKVFGDSIDYKRVDIYSSVLSKTDSLTLGFANSILVASDAYSEDMSADDTNIRGHFIHEMTHIWQSQKGQFTTLKGALMHGGAILKGFFKGLFSDKSISTAIAIEKSKLYNIMEGEAKPLSGYNMEQQARAVERNFTASESCNPLTAQELKGQEILNKTPSFPNKEALSDK